MYILLTHVQTFYTNLSHTHIDFSHTHTIITLGHTWPHFLKAHVSHQQPLHTHILSIALFYRQTYTHTHTNKHFLTHKHPFSCTHTHTHSSVGLFEEC